MKYFFFLIIISFLIISCKREEEAFEPTYCSPENQFAPCENQNEKCYKGKCIDKNLKCGGTIDAFCDNGDECKRDEETREFKCFEGRCTIRNQNGYCTNEEESCYHGYCKKPCSSENTTGGCTSKDEICFDETCLPKNNLCSDNNKNGKCNSKNKCTKQADGHYRCTALCHRVDDDEADYSEMPCPNSGEECVEGECLHIDNRCSSGNPDGECPSFQTCLNNKCENKCSARYPEGVCLGEDQDCVTGNCVFKCSTNHPDGHCDTNDVGQYGGCEAGTCKKPCELPENAEGTEETAEDGYCAGVQWCKNQHCVDPCDINHKNGICEDDTYYCNNGICEKRDCSQQFPDGYCPKENDIEQRCVNFICVKPCSNDNPNGWCNDGQFCYEGSCKTPLQIPCEEPNGIFCSNNNFECIANECVLKPCAIGFSGRCENPNETCYTVTGECFLMCEDFRRIICKDGETPEANGCINKEDMPDSSTYSTCCISSQDCLTQGEDISTPDNNRCVDDGNPIGKYCNKIGNNTCGGDSDCNDAYPYSENEGVTQKYYCVSFFDQTENLNISFCERAKDGCSALRNKMEGQLCNQDCGDADCIYGLHCIDGICTQECNQNSTCSTVNNGKQLECKLYSEDKTYPGYTNTVTSNICRNICTSNKDCKLSQNECNNYYNRIDLNDDNLPLFSTCGNKKPGKIKNKYCDNDEECASRLCIKNKCSEPCLAHEDCGTSGYCDYNKALIKDSKTINFLGVCRYLAPSTSRKNDCTSSSDCPTETVTVSGSDRHYRCLPYTDNQDTIRGICGIRDISLGVISKEGGPCHSPNQYCDTNICSDNTLNLTNEAGTCRELCSETAECSTIEINNITQKQICRMVKFREGAPETGNNRKSLGGMCVPAPMSSLSDCKTTKCALDGETCILNPVNNHTDINEPWKFSVEYLCVAENPAGRAFGANCDNDTQCKSNICSSLTNKCVTACTTDAQCSGFGTETCNTNYPAVNDINSSNWILGGVCE